MELWTQEHVNTLLPSLAVMLVITVVLRLTIGKKSLKVRMIPFQILACILFALEIGKQAVSLSRGYDLYHLPFHFCSLFIFALPLMAFYRGKHERLVRGVTAALCGALFLLMLIYPNLIYSGTAITEFFTEFLSFHTVAFHNIVMLEFMLIIGLELHTPQSKIEWRNIALVTLAFCAVAAVMAQLLQTNFANFYICNIGPIEALVNSVKEVLGGVVTQIIYVILVACAHILFVQLAYWLYRLVRRIVTRKSAAVV